MKISLYNLFSISLLFLLITLVQGCAGFRPVAVYRGNVYLGIFSYERKEFNNAIEYSSLKGGGIAIGLSRLGIGYYSLKETRVIGFADCQARTPLVEIYLGKDAVKQVEELGSGY